MATQSMFGAPMTTPAPAPAPAQPQVSSPVNQQVKLDSGFGAVQDVQNAWMGRLQPQMDQARQGEINRLKSQGITEGSEAWQNAMDTLNRSDTDARNQALIQGTSAYNDIFNRGLAQNNQVFGQNLQGAEFANQSNQQRWNQNQGQQQMALQLRQQQLQEALGKGNLSLAQRQQLMSELNNPYQQMMWLNSMGQGNPQFGNFTNAGQGSGTNYTGAGNSQYLGNLGNWNAKTAANNGMISGIGQLFGGWGNNSGNSSSTGGGMLGGIGDFLKYFGIGG